MKAIRYVQAPAIISFPADAGSLQGKWYVHCKAALKSDVDDQKGFDLYLHSDGFWHRETGSNGIFDSVSDAEAVRATAVRFVSDH